jgi:MFS family permease
MKILDVLAIVVVIPQLFTLNYPIVIICRLLMGFYCAITIGLVPAWIISLAPQQLSGIFGTFSYLSIAAGLL